MDHEGALVVAHDLQTGQVNQLELSIAAERFMSKAPGGGFLFQTRIDELTLTDNTLAIQGVYSLPDTEPIAWTKRTREPIRSVAFDVDGNYLAVLGYGWTSIQRIDLQSGHNESMLLEGHEDVVRAMTFSPDGRRLASGGDDGTVRIWDTRLGAELLLIEGNRHAIVDLAFSPDGSRLASASSDGVIRTYETRPPAQWARSQAAKRDRIESLKPIVARLVARPPDELATGLDLEKARFPADAPILDQLVFMALADSRNSLVHREVLASYEQEVQHSWDDPLLLHLLSGDWSYVRDNDPLRASPEVLKELRELSRRAAKRSCQLTDFQDVSNLRELVSVLERHHELEPDAGHDVEAAKYRQMLEEIRDVEAAKYRQWLEETQKANSNATAEPAAP